MGDVMTKGILYGIGMGPGDPELLTLKAVRLMQSVPVIAYPAPLEGDSMARSIAAPHLPGTQHEIAIRMSFRPEPGAGDAAYDQGAAEIAACLEAGRDVAFLCEGDPLFFGSFAYVLSRLQGRFEIASVPGIASPMAAASALVRPLSIREESLVILPATMPEAELERRLADADAAVVMKLGRHLGKVRAVLDRLGLTQNAHYIEKIGHADQRIRSLDEAGAEGAPYFSLLLVAKRGPTWI